ncbi:hypothetical protein SAMD00019534_094170 [Acytostelium subglobosum LB1]|uniref:hypothetical protein n=1 Tax=Acytostelium subglobosum LB1 TaxID=1410327 RepID=UPI000644CBEE|nr:hypothetical protein SAMD00019534_094170 [Acytostelium subglobosum LB1]GAM26242.1 hypothetical protein SAMD00019534_094170 [Acytostelium subglobosum LB1]|eukprot:XP_012750796.1 hypothetical protein SAMD00019534_094170 [Acytostelium subglobosum LB1]
MTYYKDNVHPDLKAERAKTSFNIETLYKFIHNNDPSVLELKRAIRAEFEKDQVLSGNPEFINFLSREEQFKRTMDITHRLIDMKKRLNLLDASSVEILRECYSETPLLLHDVVFVPCLRSLASDSQLKVWLPQALNYKMIGSYSQTEMGHGSNVQALETTAHYHADTDEFELHSPTLTSTKWWVGALGKICTHTVVFAQLWLKNENGTLTNHGPHPFLLQVRSTKDYTPLKGIKVGDIGPKYGYNCVDNGFMRLDKVRIPRANMLNRFFNVTREGKYVPPAHPRLVYAGMVSTRVYIISDSCAAVGRAVTVAARYSAVRRQFSGAPNTPELQVLDYGNQQTRIIPGIATAYALVFVGRRLKEVFSNVMYAAMTRSDTSQLPEMHALTSGLKSLVTYITAKHIDDARLACGGHGYSIMSGLPRLLVNYSHLITAEGENNLMPQQTTRYLLARYKDVMINGKKQLAESVQYIVREADDASPKTLTQLLDGGKRKLTDLDVLEHVLGHRAYAQLARLAGLIQAGLETRPLGEVWSEYNIDAVKVSDAHCQLYIVHCFASCLTTAPLDARPVLIRLCQLYALVNIEKLAADVLVDGYFTPEQVELVSAEVRRLLKELRPDVIGLVDTFNYADHTLGSALGRYDGQVYEAINHFVANNPLNTADVGMNEFILNPVLLAQGAPQQSRL